MTSDDLQRPLMTSDGHWVMTNECSLMTSGCVRVRLIVTDPLTDRLIATDCDRLRLIEIAIRLIPSPIAHLGSRDCSRFLTRRSCCSKRSSNLT